MKVDYLSYRRATGISFLGLVIQAVLGLLMLIHGVIHRDEIAMSAAMYILIGIPAWLTLGIVYDQHRRERLESLEAENLDRAGRGASSVFREGGDELKVAARRLAWMHKILLPAASLGIAGLLIGVGWWRLSQVLRADVLNQDSAGIQGLRGWPIALGIFIAVVGFAFARFVSTMAKQKFWANLRGGAGFSVGAALVALAIIIGHFVDLAGPDIILRWLHVVIPGMMIALGGEVILNFLLTMYRPRKQGEMPRAAFDSQILGLVAAPDRVAESIGSAINYQFGFDVTSSWFYQLLTRWVTSLVVVAALVLWLMTVVAVVQPNEQGLRIKLGSLQGEALPPGAYFKAPWPFERIERVRTTQPIRVELASPPPGDVRSLLWTNDHKVEERYYVVQARTVEEAAADAAAAAATPAVPAPSTAPGSAAAAPASRPSTEFRGIALVSVQIPLVYTITDAVKYKGLAQDGMQQEVIRAIGRREVLRYLASRQMDDVLGGGRTDAAKDLRQIIAAKLRAIPSGAGKPPIDAGVNVLYVGIEGVHPPKDTAPLFEQVIKSELGLAGAIQNAQTEKTRILAEVVGSVEAADRIKSAIVKAQEAQRTATPADARKLEDEVAKAILEAGGKAGEVLHQARTERWARHLGARGRAELATGQVIAYRAAPEVYMARKWFESLGEVMQTGRIMLLPGGSIEIRLNLETTGSGGDVFRNKMEENEPLTPAK